MFGDGISDVRYFRATKTVWKKNEISGHTWPEYVPLKHWIVRGGFFSESKHRTEIGAIREVKSRIEFNKKHPPTGVK